jgi:hypothetical protein
MEIGNTVHGKRTDSPIDIVARGGRRQEMYGSVSAVKWWSVKSCVNNSTITRVTAPIASNQLCSAYCAATMSPVLITRGDQTWSVTLFDVKFLIYLLQIYSHSSGCIDEGYILKIKTNDLTDIRTIFSLNAVKTWMPSDGVMTIYFSVGTLSQMIDLINNESWERNQIISIYWWEIQIQIQLEKIDVKGHLED